METLPLRWIDIILIVFAVNGLFIALILINSKKGNRISRIINSTLLMLLSIDIVYRPFYAANYHFLFPHLAVLDSAIPFAYGPLLYLYVKTYTEKQNRIKRVYYLHFIPMILYFLKSLPFYLKSSMDKIISLQNYSPTLLGALNLGQHIKLAYTSIYIILTIILLKKHNRKIKNTYSSIEKINLQWMKYLLYAFIVGGLFHNIMITFFSFSGGDFYTRANEINHLFVGIVIYFLGYKGITQSVFIPSNEGFNAAKKYEKSTLTEKRSREKLKKLLTYMEREKPFINSELTLPKLAKYLSISPHHLSQIINEKLNQNFFEFVNRYRVEEAKKLLADSNVNTRTILDIAYDTGFNSKSTFNAMFKKYIKMTPSYYRKTHTN